MTPDIGKKQSRWAGFMEDNRDVIRLNNLIFYAYHGVDQTEKERGQRFEIDVEMFLALKRPGHTDRLEDTVDYTQVYQLIEETVLEGEFKLLEALAEEIAQKILHEFPVEEIVVRVRKPHVSLRGISDGVEVEIYRS